jgi:hypothetical protein
MEGRVRGSSTSLRVTRGVESSRLQLECVRRAFELLVPNSRHPVAKVNGTRRQQRSAAAASRVSVAGG